MSNLSKMAQKIIDAELSLEQSKLDEEAASKGLKEAMDRKRSASRDRVDAEAKLNAARIEMLTNI